MIISKEQKSEVLSKIEKLMAHTKNEHGVANENEMVIANKLIKELMDKYDISIDEIKVTSNKSTLVSKFESEIYTQKGVKGWIMSLSGIISRFYDCRCVKHGKQMLFIGFEMDANVAMKMFDYVYIQIHRASYKATETPSLRKNEDRRIDFCVGAVYSLSGRLNEIKNERKSNVDMNALVVVKKDVINEQINKMFLKLKTSKGDKYHESEEYVNGVKFGKIVNIYKPELLKE